MICTQGLSKESLNVILFDNDDDFSGDKDTLIARISDRILHGKMIRCVKCDDYTFPKYDEHLAICRGSVETNVYWYTFCRCTHVFLVV